MNGTKDIVVVAHNIRSLWNIGSLFRSADAFDVAHIHLTGYTAAPPRKEIGKTALGADEWIPWSKEADPLEVIEKRRNEGYRIVALELNDTSTPLSEFKSKDNVCLILGHEILGVSKELLQKADDVVHIPMLGKKGSLNVSVATGIALHHVRCCC